MCALMRDRGMYVCVCVRACLREAWCVRAVCVRARARKFVQASTQTLTSLCVWSMCVCMCVCVLTRGGGRLTGRTRETVLLPKP